MQFVHTNNMIRNKIEIYLIENRIKKLFIIVFFIVYISIVLITFLCYLSFYMNPYDALEYVYNVSFTITLQNDLWNEKNKQQHCLYGYGCVGEFTVFKYEKHVYTMCKNTDYY